MQVGDRVLVLAEEVLGVDPPLAIPEGTYGAIEDVRSEGGYSAVAVTLDIGGAIDTWWFLDYELEVVGDGDE